MSEAKDALLGELVERRWKIDRKVLLRARRDANLTQAEFARCIGVINPYYWKLENGKIRTVGDEMFWAIIEVLCSRGVEVDWKFRDSEEYSE